MRSKLALFCTVALLSVLLACATNPVTGKKEISLMSEAQEVSMGREADTQVRQEMSVYNDPALVEYVNAIGQRLAATSHRPQLAWHFTVVDEAAVNAFALPGGYIYITRGILAYLNDEAELAGVIGHEIGHVTARHSAQQYTRAVGGQLGLLGLGIFVPAARPFGQMSAQALGLLFLKYGRDDELQADDLGAQYAAKNGYDPAAVPGFLSTLGRIGEASDRKGIPNWLSTHPQPADRVEKIQQTVAKLKTADTRFARDREPYLRRIDGIIFGDNPREGIVRGSEFLHPDLRFQLRFPEGWEINNGKQQVVVKEPGAERYMLLQLVQKPQGRTTEEIAVRGMSSAGFQQIDGARTTVNGLDAYVGTWRGNIQDLGDTAMRAGFVSLRQQVYMIAGLSPVQGFNQVEAAFTGSIRSFQEMTVSEAEGVHPNRVDLYTVRAGDTWQSIAERVSKGVVKPTTLAIMNSHPVNEQPRPGDRIKVVVAG